MEIQTLLDDHLEHDDEKPSIDYHSNVDTSRPFRSVKEAVAIFGEKLLVGEIYSSKPFTFSNQETPYYSPSPQKFQERSWRSESFTPSPKNYSIDHSNDPTFVDTLKKLEVELEETKTELKLLKERESETEVALASLNAELHKNMSKLAQAEAAAASRAIASSRSMVVRGSSGEVDEITSVKEEEKKRELKVKWDSRPTLAEFLTDGEKEAGLFGFGGRKKDKKLIKKKPIIPLVANLFSRKKGSTTTSLNNPLYAFTHGYLM